MIHYIPGGRPRGAREYGGLKALHDKTRCKLNPQYRVEPQIEQAVLNFGLGVPAHDQVRGVNELRNKEIFTSPSGVRSIWPRHALQSRKLR